jgi:hypothetical protein
LARHTAISLLPLLDVFDCAFDPVIHARWDSAVNLSVALGNIRIGASDAHRDESAEEMIEQLKRAMERHDERRQRRRAHLEQAFFRMRHGINLLMQEIPGLIITQGGYTLDAATGRASGMLGLLKASDSRGFDPRYSHRSELIDLRDPLVLNMRKTQRCAPENSFACATRKHQKCRGGASTQQLAR